MLYPSQIHIFVKLTTRHMKRTLENKKASESGGSKFAL